MHSDVEASARNRLASMSAFSSTSPSHFNILGSCPFCLSNMFFQYDPTMNGNDVKDSNRTILRGLEAGIAISVPSATLICTLVYFIPPTLLERLSHLGT